MDEVTKNVLLENKGNITCDKTILLSIINLATKEISGVSSLCDGFWTKFKKMFSKNKNDNKGVKIKFDTNGSLLIDVSLKIFYGYNVPDIAYKVQENIKSNISSMVDMKTAKVNVHVVGVEFKDEEK